MLFAYSLEQRPESLFITEPAGKEIVDVSFFIQNGNYNTVIVMRDGRVRKEITGGEIEVFDGLPHGFGLGIGTAAEGWLDNAVRFWERNMSE